MYREQLCLFNFKRAVMVEGGRGSGKTMFLKYHCHQTRFSSKRISIKSEELHHVGLYFRPDTDFCAMINHFNFDDDWRKVFSHYVFINLIEEFYSAIYRVANTTFDDISFESSVLDQETPKSIQKNIEDFPHVFKDLKVYAKGLASSFNLWLHDPDSFDKPLLIEPRTVIWQLIDHLRDLSSELRDLSFYIYIDEFENLTADQQKIINSWMKHGKEPLIFNAAYKKGAKVNRETLSDERLVQRNDYRIVDLEAIKGSDFRVFAAEVLTLKLMEAVKIDEYLPIKRYFGDESSLDYRRKSDHQEKVLKIARLFLPEFSYKEIAANIVKNESLRKRLEKFLISPALQDDRYSSEDFVDTRYPEESLINGLLLNRKSYNPDSVKKIFDDARDGTNKDAYKSLVEQNLAGAILWIYLSASWKKCPMYAGFDRFCLMARGNMRHFLELCHQTLIVASRNGLNISHFEVPSMPVDFQAEAASYSGRIELEKIDELGRHGEKLRFIANRLGLFFQLIQKRKSQSETEVNHFSIRITDKDQLDETTKTLIEESVIWSVLIEIEGDTKRKGITDLTSKEYMLHPIYSPHFGISFRRKKKFEFSPEQVQVIFSGKEEDFVELCKGFVRKWDLGIEQFRNDKGNSSAEVVQRGLWD
jgi:hypothetical protein